MSFKPLVTSVVISSTLLLGACSDKPAEDVKAFLASDGVKQIASWGYQAIHAFFKADRG